VDFEVTDCRGIFFRDRISILCVTLTRSEAKVEAFYRCWVESTKQAQVTKSKSSQTGLTRHNGPYSHKRVTDPLYTMEQTVLYLFFRN